jgi:hypothetical protein
VGVTQASAHSLELWLESCFKVSQRLHIGLSDGTELFGVLTVVGGDFVTIRPEEGSGMRVIPFTAIVFIDPGTGDS